MLHAEHHAILIADTAAEAREMLGRHPVDLLITDIYMPEEDGLQVIAYTRRLHPSVVIIAMSSKSGSWDMLEPARYLGASFTMYKPFSPEFLRSLVGRALALCPADPELR